ncbi:hypothetical protein Mgra_00007758 [Meloidogyne graminicola]|uniref:Uncharacterized protein n=1 Tax=Meloidogyne graminicola TaxID=189291 RepID=A0A8S9ZHN6_9BILA|nr:hypothetical protein Mgra_00007758 [Meloidogyne graminicola]
MVEIREETSADEQNDSANSSGHQPNTANVHQKTPMEFVKENPNEVLCFGLRLATLYFVICYLLPITDPKFQGMVYTKAFAAVAATNAFRLHQRLKNVNFPFFSQMFLHELMIEDSAHYLLYCMIFVMSSPITLALLPVSIYAIFNIINTLNKFSNETGIARNSSFISWLVQFKQQTSPNMLSTSACAEIFLLPIIILMIFMFVIFFFLNFLLKGKVYIICSICLLSFFDYAIYFSTKSVHKFLIRNGNSSTYSVCGRNCFKIVIILLTIVVLLLLDPSYVTAYISINYEIVLIYIICALTLLYCVVSIIMYAIMQKSVREGEELHLTNCSLSEIVFAGAGMICWMLVCGIGGTVAQRTIIDTGEYFGWLGACAGIIVCLFGGVLALFALDILTNKILSPRRKYRYTPPQN